MSLILFPLHYTEPLQKDKTISCLSERAGERIKIAVDQDSNLLSGNMRYGCSRHGYDSAREINRRSGNALKLKQRTHYPTLHALERNVLIAGP